MLFDLLSRCPKQRDFLDNEWHYKWTSAYIENILYGDLILVLRVIQRVIQSNSEAEENEIGEGKVCLSFNI